RVRAASATRYHAMDTYQRTVSHRILFFYCYGDHRDLHSFPTRRSSDLPLPAWSRSARRRRASPSAPRRQRAPCRAALHAGLALVDRKSTRLNSSHVKISYAVFCLKKKKRNIKPHTSTI